MNYLDVVIDKIINNFDFAYMFIVNVLTYIIIKIVDYVNGDAKVPTWTKRLILIISIIVVSTMRPIFIKLGIGYKQIDDYMN